MTYKELINTLQTIIGTHRFVETQGYGNISDIIVPDNEEAPNYPYVFINPVDIDMGRTNFTVNLNLIAMTQVSDSDDNELTGQDLCIQILADIFSEFTNTTDFMLYDVVTPISITPFKERFADDVVGATAAVTINYAKAIDGCNTPFI